MANHGRVLFKPPGAIAKPLFSKRYVNPHPMSVLHKLAAFLGCYAVEHLKFIFVLGYLVFVYQIKGSLYQGGIMCSNGRIDIVFKHEFEVFKKVGINFVVILICNACRFHIDSFDQSEVQSGIVTTQIQAWFKTG